MFKAFMKLVQKVGLERAENIFRLRPGVTAAQMRTYRIMAREGRKRAERAGRARTAKPAKTFPQRKAARVAKPMTARARENFRRRERELRLRDEMLGETGVPMFGYSKLLRDQARRRANAASNPRTFRGPASARQALEMGRSARTNARGGYMEQLRRLIDEMMRNRRDF